MPDFLDSISYLFANIHCNFDHPKMPRI